MSGEINTLIIWDRFGDYHWARANALRKKIGDALYTAELGSGDDIYLWEKTSAPKNHFILSEKPVQQSDFFRRVRNFIRALKKSKAQVVFISGYGKIEYIFFILLSNYFGVKVILFAESWYSGKIDKLKSLFLRKFINGFFVSGKRAEDHFMRNLKIPKEKIIRGYSVVDNYHFSGSSKLKLNQKHILLCVARYSEEKDLVLLIEAFKGSSIVKNWKLVLIGDGPKKGELEKEASENVHLIGWRNYNELPVFYHSASAFVLPSLFEPWGLVVNEAMAAGLPVLLSKDCGCLPDLLKENFNGYSFEAGNKKELVEKLNLLNNLPLEKLISMGQDSKEIVQSYSLDMWVTKALKFIQ